MKTRRQQQPRWARIAGVVFTYLAGLALMITVAWLVLAAVVWIFLQPILFLLFALAHAT